MSLPEIADFFFKIRAFESIHRSPLAPLNIRSTVQPRQEYICPKDADNLRAHSKPFMTRPSPCLSCMPETRGRESPSVEKKESKALPYSLGLWNSRSVDEDLYVALLNRCERLK